jgi:hypothetical protein
VFLEEEEGFKGEREKNKNIIREQHEEKGCMCMMCVVVKKAAFKNSTAATLITLLLVDRQTERSPLLLLCTTTTTTTATIVGEGEGKKNDILNSFSSCMMKPAPTTAALCVVHSFNLPKAMLCPRLAAALQ